MSKNFRVNDSELYFEYLKLCEEVPQIAKLNFTQYKELLISLQQAKEGKLIPAKQVFAEIKKKYNLSK